MKSTRQFSKSRVLIFVVLLVFIAGYSSIQLGPAKSFTTTKLQTRTLATTSTVTDSNSSYAVSTTPNLTESVISSTTTFVTVVNSSTVTSTLLILNTTTLAASSATTGSTATTSSTGTNTTLPSTGGIFKIPQSVLRNWLNLTSNSVSFVPSWTNVPYYMVTQSKSTVGVLYLTTDVALGSCWGYEGYIETLVLVNTTGFIKALTINSNPDSYVYMITQTWLNTYINRSLFESLQIGEDAKAVTGATYSSAGVIDGVRDAGRIVVNDYRQQQNANASRSGTALILGVILNVFGSIETSSFQTQSSLIALVCLFAVAVIAFELNSDRIKYGVWVGSIVFIGFYAVRMVTMGDFVEFTNWVFPPFWRNIYWYVLYGGVLVTSLIWGRFYCGYLCPFGTFTYLLNKFSPVKLKIPLKYQSKLRYTKYVVLAVVVAEILQKTVLYQVEPFGTFFLFSGDTFAWIFLGLILGVSIFFNRFYCKYICPAGAGTALLGWFRMREIKRWPECKRCMICANQCELQAIKGDHISAFECMNCRGCEKLYLNTKLCPHYALQRAAAKK